MVHDPPLACLLFGDRWTAVVVQARIRVLRGVETVYSGAAAAVTVGQWAGRETGDCASHNHITSRHPRHGTEATAPPSTAWHVTCRTASRHSPMSSVSVDWYSFGDVEDFAWLRVNRAKTEQSFQELARKRCSVFHEEDGIYFFSYLSECFLSFSTNHEVGFLLAILCRCCVLLGFLSHCVNKINPDLNVRSSELINVI